MFGKRSFCEGYRLDLVEQNLGFPLFTIRYPFLLASGRLDVIHHSTQAPIKFEFPEPFCAHVFLHPGDCSVSGHCGFRSFRARFRTIWMTKACLSKCFAVLIGAAFIRCTTHSSKIVRCSSCACCQSGRFTSGSSFSILEDDVGP